MNVRGIPTAPYQVLHLLPEVGYPPCKVRWGVPEVGYPHAGTPCWGTPPGQAWRGGGLPEVGYPPSGPGRGPPQGPTGVNRLKTLLSLILRMRSVTSYIPYCFETTSSPWCLPRVKKQFLVLKITFFPNERWECNRRKLNFSFCRHINLIILLFHSPEAAKIECF